MGMPPSRFSRFLRRATDESIRADVIGVLFLLGALFSVVSLVFPHPDQGEMVIWAVVVVAVLTGIALIGLSHRWTLLMIQVVVAFGSVLINLMMLASGVAAGVYAAMFCWVVLVSVNFFSPRMAVAQFAWMMGLYALVLTDVDSGGDYAGITRWVTLTLALAVTGGATAWLVYRRRLAEEAAQRFMDLSQEMLCTIGPDDRLTRVSSEWERMLGYPTSSLYSMDILDLIHPLDRAETEEAFTKLRDGTPALKLENRVRGGQGDFHALVWSASFSGDESLIYARVRPKVPVSPEIDRRAARP